MLLTCVANFMVTLDALVVVTALPSIHRSLGGGITTLQWTLTAYTMTFGAGIVTAAELGDRLGRRRVYVFGLMLFTAASAMCALAPNAGLLIGFRALQGLGRRLRHAARHDASRPLPSRPSAAAPWSGSGRGSPVWRWPPVRLSAAPSRRARAGTGSSGSTSLSVWWLRSARGCT